MSNAVTMRRPICAEDPPEVWELFAKLLALYASAIERDVADILEKFPGATGTTYIEQIGENIPDHTIRAAVKRLAASKFRQKGMAV